MKRCCLAAIVCVYLSTISTSVFGQEWTRFRGPNGSGVSEATTVPVKWSDADFNWKIELPGQGHSSPVIWGEKLFITSADAKKGQRYLLCYNKLDGSLNWQRDFEFSPYKKHSGNTFAANTPVVDAHRVYVLWQSREGSSLGALDHDGKPVWQFDMGMYKSGHGTGSSPIVHDGMVIVCNDHDADSFLVAVDAKTGEQVWRMERIGDRACYSTPCVFQPKYGPTEIIFTHSFRGITGVDAKTGNKNWEIDVFGTHKQRAVGSPVIWNDLVIGSSGFTTAEKNVVAVRPSKSGEEHAIEEVYRLNRQVPHVPSPLVYEDRLYLWTDTGIVSCIDVASGKVVWQKRVGGNFFGSPVCVGRRLYCVDRDGVCTVLAASDEYELLAQNDLGDECRSTPAVSDGVMYLRTLSHLMSLGGSN